MQPEALGVIRHRNCKIKAPRMKTGCQKSAFWLKKGCRAFLSPWNHTLCRQNEALSAAKGLLTESESNVTGNFVDGRIMMLADVIPQSRRMGIYFTYTSPVGNWPPPLPSPLPPSGCKYLRSHGNRDGALQLWLWSPVECCGCCGPLSYRFPNSRKQHDLFPERWTYYFKNY